ncbi:hypothetical protein Tco_0305152 [Tanacetum coccineum]
MQVINPLATSTTEAEYVAAANCCGQVLWIQNQMLDYGFNFMNTKIYIDNESTICIVKNLVFHSKTKHIEIRHHFIRDAYEKKLIQVLKIHTDDNIVDLLTKAFDVSRLRATYGAKLVSATGLVNTARPTLSAVRLVLLSIFLILNSFGTLLVPKQSIMRSKIYATVDSKALVVTEASIRSSLLLNDVDGTACLTNEAIFQNLALMVYEGELNKLTFQKALFSPQWMYLIHTILHCLSSKSTSWNEFSTNIASAIICLATNQKFNFSKLIFDGTLRNLDTSKKKFLMYLRFIMVFLNNQIELGEPFNDVYVTPAHTQKVFSNMSKKGVKFSRKVTPLFDSMLVPHQALEGEGSEQPTEPQPTPSPTHSSTGDQPPMTDSSSSHDTTQDFKDSLEGTNGSEGDQVQPSHDSPLLGDHTSEKAKGRKNAKPEPNLDAFDDLDAGGRDYMETEDVVKEGRQSNETKELNKGSREKGGSAEELVSTAVLKIVSTARPELSTARPDVDAVRQEDSVVEPRTPPTTTSIFHDEDVTMVQTLIKMKEEKAKEKRKIARQLQVNLQVEVEMERQREEEASKAAIAEMYDKVQVGIDADALFTAKLQQKEKEEYTIEERAKFLVERSTEIRSRPPTKSQLRNLMITYLKNMGGYKHSQLKAKTFAKIQGLYERQKRVINDFKPMDSDDAVKYSKEAASVHKQKDLEEPNITKILTDMEQSASTTESLDLMEVLDDTEIHMLVERKYPLTKETLKRMLALRLIAEFESKAVFDLLRFIQKKIVESEIHGGDDVEPEPNLPLQEIIILDPDDQPMWESAKTVAPTPNSAIIQLDVDDNFVINGTHLNMIRKNKFDGYLRVDPHDHIREFLAICNMFRYGKTVKLMIFPLTLCDEAKF